MAAAADQGTLQTPSPFRMLTSFGHCCGHSAFFENWCFNPNPNPNPDPNPNPNPNPYLLLQSIETSENKILHSLNMYARATTFFFLIKFQIHSAHI